MSWDITFLLQIPLKHTLFRHFRIELGAGTLESSGLRSRLASLYGREVTEDKRLIRQNRAQGNPVKHTIFEVDKLRSLDFNEWHTSTNAQYLIVSMNGILL